MARIVFDVDIASGADQIVEALNTREGIAGWWTDAVSSGIARSSVFGGRDGR